MSTEISPDGKTIFGYDDEAKQVNIMDRQSGAVSTRPYTPEELVALAERKRQQNASQVEAQLSAPSTVDPKIEQLTALIDRGSTVVPTGIAEVTTMQHLLNMSNATINQDFPSNAGRYLKFLVRIQLRLANALILALRLSGKRFNSADLGE